MDRAHKEQAVTDLNKSLAAAEGIVLTHNLGLNAADISDLRKKVRGVNGRFKVAKNRLISRALKGTKFEALDDKLSGPTAIVYGKDPFALTKVICTFAKANEKLKVVGGAMDDGKAVDAKGIEALSKLPSLNEIRATLIGLIQAPASKMARVLDAYAKKDQG